MRPSHIPTLDGLRAVAVLLVMLLHAGVLIGGYVGVDIFFSLSGFLITSLLLGEYRQTGSISFRKFYARRVLRLAPALLLLLISYRIFVPHLMPRRDGSWDADVLIALFYSTNWFRAFEHWRAPDLLGHTWSLSIEEQFYFVEPLFLFIVLRRWPRRLVLAIVIGICASVALKIGMTIHGTPSARIYNGFDTRMDALLFGALGAALLAEGPLRPETRGWLKLLLVVAIAFLSIVALGVSYKTTFMLSVGYSLTALLSTVVVVCLVENTSPRLDRILSSAPLVWLGSISYGIYLWHYPIFRIISARVHHSVVVMLLGTGITCLVAAASFHLLEKPFLKLKGRFAPDRGIAPPIPAASGATHLV